MNWFQQKEKISMALAHLSKWKIHFLFFLSYFKRKSQVKVRNPNQFWMVDQIASKIKWNPCWVNQRIISTYVLLYTDVSQQGGGDREVGSSLKVTNFEILIYKCQQVIQNLMMFMRLFWGEIVYCDDTYNGEMVWM